MSDAKRTRILAAALETFLRYGYKRVNMQEIAESAGISRQGLYLYFKTKEDVFAAAVEQRAENLLEEIRRGIEKKKTAADKILYAFDVWTIRDFEREVASPEAREIQEYTHPFMSKSFEKMREKFEAILASVLTASNAAAKAKGELAPEHVAHLVYSAMRGFKLASKNGPELRTMLRDLLTISLPAK